MQRCWAEKNNEIDITLPGPADQCHQFFQRYRYAPVFKNHAVAPAA